jgi:hypothetical protein
MVDLFCLLNVIGEFFRLSGLLGLSVPKQAFHSLEGCSFENVTKLIEGKENLTALDSRGILEPKKKVGGWLLY